MCVIVLFNLWYFCSCGSHQGQIIWTYFHPWHFHALDEMMIRFSGRSVETHRIKYNPIKERFKFFVPAIKNGFAINFSPDGRIAAKKLADGKIDYKVNVEHGKIGSMILCLVESIVKLKEKQNISHTRISSQRTTRTNDIVEKRKKLNEKI